MNQKVLAFIKKRNKYLVLRSNPHPDHGPSKWFTVTGSVNSGETLKNAIKREVKEETNLDVTKVYSTSYFSEYEWPKDSGQMHHEKAFIAEVNGKIKLDMIEVIEYQWLSKKNFINILYWEGNKKELKRILDEKN